MDGDELINNAIVCTIIVSGFVRLGELLYKKRNVDNVGISSMHN